jgi:sigma-B regulation protein RsbU (phosphoserine phosphatase)
MGKPRSRKPTLRPSPAELSPASLVEEVEDLGGQLCSKLEPAAVMSSLTGRLVERYGATVTGVWALQGNGSSFRLVTQAGKPEMPRELGEATLEGTLLGKAVVHRHPQTVLKKNGKQDQLSRWAERHRLSFLAAYPLLDDARVQGVLLIACAKAPPKTYLTLFRLHAQLASMALRDAELFSATQRTLNKLSFLVEASKALNSTLDLCELLGRILDVAKSQVEADRGSLFLVDEQTQEIWSLIAQGLEKQEIRLPMGKGIAGHVAETGEVVLIADAYADARFNPEVDKKTGYQTRTILCLPIRNKAGKIIAALQLLNKKHGAFTQEDADFLLTLSGHMALALENAQLHQQLLDKERMEKELALARGIQRSLLPETTPLIEGFDIAVLNEPCYAVGGDYYDFLNLGANTLLVVIADVEGKGVSSALVMSNLQATLRALVLQLHSLDEIAESLNRMILTDTRSQKYLSIFMGLIDVRRKGIHYINCGHVPPLVVHPGREPVTLSEGGMVIGLFENVQYERGHKPLQRGDVLILCTDGITESMNAFHEEYGADRIVQCVESVADRSAGEIVTALSTDVARFSRQGTHIDDKVTIIIKIT